MLVFFLLTAVCYVFYEVIFDVTTVAGDDGGVLIYNMNP